MGVGEGVDGECSGYGFWKVVFGNVIIEYWTGLRGFYYDRVQWFSMGIRGGSCKRIIHAS